MSPDAPRRRTRVSETAPAPHVARRLLLDTHAWLWWLQDSPRLGDAARRTIVGAGDVCVSIVTPWEVALKAAVGKLSFPQDVDIGELLEDDAFSPLAISLHHITALRALPMHHRDPFDRTLVAQAQVEGLAIVSADPRFLEYDVAVVDATR